MKIRFLGILITAAFLFSCAGGPGVKDTVPLWVDSVPEDTGTYRVFSSIGYGANLSQARQDAQKSLLIAVLEGMGFLGLDFEKTEEVPGLKELSDQLNQLIRQAGYSGLEGASLEHRDGWRNAEGDVAYGVVVFWERTALEKKVEELSSMVGIAGPEYQAFVEKAKAAENRNDPYEAALLWGRAGAAAEAGNFIAGAGTALKKIEGLLTPFTYRVVSLPEEAYQNSRPEEPVVFQVLSGGTPVANAEFVITYPGRSRDGSAMKGEARLDSDESGLVYFRPPEIAFEGVQVITIAPSANPFLKGFSNLSFEALNNFVDLIETPVLETSFEAMSPLRSISLGILILETDLAGNPLDSSHAAGGLLDHLLSDGFNVSVVELDSRDILERNEKELLRDLKADRQFSGQYERVIHGRVFLESFEQNGNNFTVRVSGTLAMSDIQKQVTLYRSKISKSSRASGSEQAISAAFRQLGRSFAEELSSQAP
ncbi:MAG: hypothetical protein CSA76_05560 [Spirochaetales bacterium]|nr:MAG: hypothetical protein CSA76_05560 [Spirochaetales bacterium]